MKLGYWVSPHGNFGDDLNPWLWPRLLPGSFQAESPAVLIGIGSILDKRFDGYSQKIVLGAGARDARSVPVLDASWTVLAVRGPLTAAALGLRPEVVATDPAVLVREFVEKESGNRDVGLVPYFAATEAWSAVASSCGYRYIPPTLPVEHFLEALRGCRRIVTESLHGAVVADALRIPWLPLRCVNQLVERETHAFKWQDWCRSLEAEYSPLELPPLWPRKPHQSILVNLRANVKLRWITHLLKKEVARDRFFLSAPETLDRQVAKLHDAIESLRKDGLRAGLSADA